MTRKTTPEQTVRAQLNEIATHWVAHDEYPEAITKTDVQDLGQTLHNQLEDRIETYVAETWSIHHVAVRVPDEDQLYEWHDLFRERGYDVSRVKDRHFFHSLYVREPGGILFELATEHPGLTTDADDDTLGQSLYLPPWLEEDRDMIESQLQPLDVSPDSETG